MFQRFIRTKVMVNVKFALSLKNVAIGVFIVNVFYSPVFSQTKDQSMDSKMIEKMMRMSDSIYNANTPDSIKKEKGVSHYYWIYDGQGNVVGGTKIKKGHQTAVTLTDSITNNYFLLDSSHITITAFDKSNKRFWKTDPYEDNSIMEYRTKRPIIISYSFGLSPDYFSEEIKPGLKVIWITYNNTQFGFIDIRNGKYYFCGQD